MTNIVVQPEVIKALADCVIDVIQNKIDWSAIDWQAVAEKAVERPQGRWESYFEHNGKTYHKCSNCHISTELILIDNFCPNCGADMRTENNNNYER